MPFKVTNFGTNRKLIYDFLLVINTNLRPTLHRFWDIAFNNRYIWLSLLRFTPPMEGSPGTISVKFSVDVITWPTYQIA